MTERTDNPPLLEVREVTRRFGALVAVDNVSFEVRKGEIFGVAGPNGSGKSTLFNVITGIPFSPSAGEVLLSGEPIHRLKPHQISRAGLVRTFQKDAEFATLSARENVYASAVYCGQMTSGEAADAAEQALDDVSLARERRMKAAADLSVFERKQLMIASAIAGRPKVLLLDEPAAGLTKPEVSDLSTLICTVHERGITVVLIEHVLPLLLKVSDHLMILNHGAIIASGRPDEVVRNPQVIEAYRQTGGATLNDAQNALDIVDLHAGYDASDVLVGMSLHVGPKERVGLFGPNGHGKTTLLNAISRVIRPRSGSVRFMGEAIEGLAPHRIVERGLVHVPQANWLFPDMLIMETLELAAFTERARQQQKTNLDYVLHLFPRLAERRQQQCKTLSGGERQMLAIGVGLMCAPRMLMLDEPTLGLSPKLKDELAEAIAEISGRGIPLLLVEQDIAFILSLVDRMYLVDHGEISREVNRGGEVDHQEIMDMYFGSEGVS